MLRALLALVQAVAAVAQLGLLALLMSATVPSLFGFESFVHAGDLAVVAPTRASAIAVGDTVVYRRPQDPDAVVVARVMYVDVEGSERVALQTRGDGDSTSDQVSVTARTTLGRLAYRIPGLGALVELLNQPPGKALLLGMPCLVLATNYLRSRRRPNAENQAERVTALLGLGRRALDAGHPRLALQAAAGALFLVPGHQEATVLQARARHACAGDVEYVAA
jgi:hypothetical protein